MNRAENFREPISHMSLTPAPSTDENIERTAGHLRAGRLVAFPTETVYGLGADARNGEAVAEIFAAKGRPAFNPLIIHVPDVETARTWAELGALAERLAAAFWPGGLTMVLNKRVGGELSELVSAGLPSIAVRVPAHPVALSLLRKANCPVAAPSANRSGHVSATTAAHVAADLDAAALAMILDDGPCAFGVESTIIDARGDAVQLLRPGAVTIEALAKVAGTVVKGASASSHGAMARSSPGQLESHYAPAKPLMMNVTQPRPDQALLAFGALPEGYAGEVYNLSPSGNLTEAAANLFAGLRRLDETTVKSIAAMPVPMDGLGLAINDRLKRAAAPRS